MDHLTKPERSINMSKVRNKDSELEIMFRRALWREGVRYRKNVSRMKGKPDLVFNGRKVVVFIDSCFWHHCPKHGHFPKSNLGYWREKLNGNFARDKQVDKHYSSNGWKVYRIWEHDLTNEKFERSVRDVCHFLRHL